MEIETFKQQLRKSKPVCYYTSSENFKLYRYSLSNKEFRIEEIPKKDKCPYCHSDLKNNAKKIKILFHNAQGGLTIFQSSLLFMLYIKNVIPQDYAKYHECEAGKEFIENIKEIIIL